MKHAPTPRASANKSCARPTRAARRLFPALILFNFAVADANIAAAQARWQLPPAPQATKQAQTAAPPAPNDDDEDESESRSDDSKTVTRPPASDPAHLLRTARVVYVRSLTVFVKASEVEDSLRKRKEFRAWGMTLTRGELDADLIIEIERKPLSRRFTFVVLEPRALAVLTSGKTRSVLFGKKIPNKIAEKFTNRVKAVRPYPPAAANP